MARILYISYDGLMEPLGQSQVLSYLEKLSSYHKIFIISYEKKIDLDDTNKINSLRESLKNKGIVWISLKYHKKATVITTSFDIALGCVFGFWVVLWHKIDIVHARSYTASVIALILKKIFNLHYIFDMRGFWVDERVDGGLWRSGSYLFHISKWFEKVFLINADIVVSLTNTAVDEMNSFPYLVDKKSKFRVITTCTDLQLFKPNKRHNSNKKERPFVLGYVGSVGVWYMFDEALYCFKLIKRIIPSARMHIINKGGHAFIYDRIRNIGIDSNSILVEETDRIGVAKAMREMSAGIFFYKQAYSKKATAPTKLGEFLGCGVPCLTNRGVGDTSAILETTKCGVVLDNFNKDTMDESVFLFLEIINNVETKGRCRKAALKYFSLNDGVMAYDKIYKSLGS
jgi:hypothetical protein